MYLQYNLLNNYLFCKLTVAGMDDDNGAKRQSFAQRVSIPEAYNVRINNILYNGFIQSNVYN